MASGTDRDAAAFLEAATIYDSRQQRGIFELVRLLKQYDLWSKMKAIYPFVGGTATTHKWNLKDPRDLDAAFRLTFYGGVTHTSTGAAGNASNAYADTYIATTPNLTENSTHLSLYSRTNKQENSQEFAGYSGGNNVTSLFLRYTTNLSGSALYSAATGVLITSTATTDSRGLFVGSRTAVNVHKFYYNGVQRGTTATGTPTLYAGNTAKISLFARNVNNTSRELWGSREFAFASAGDGLTDTDVQNLYYTVQRYQQILGRAV